jgi:hypothetical protein
MRPTTRFAQSPHLRYGEAAQVGYKVGREASVAACGPLLPSRSRAGRVVGWPVRCTVEVVLSREVVVTFEYGRSQCLQKHYVGPYYTT